MRKDAVILVLLWLFALCIVWYSSGCTVVKSPSGWEYTNTLFAKQFESVKFSQQKDGVITEFEMSGLKSDAQAVIDLLDKKLPNAP